MLAVGPSGGGVAFPAPTQAIEARTLKQALETFRANDLLDTARIGDITNGDYVEISTSGYLTFVGDATSEISRQIMGGEKTSVADNTATTIVTFTMPTGPSSLGVMLKFVGSSTDATDIGIVEVEANDSIKDREHPPAVKWKQCQPPATLCCANQGERDHEQ